MTALDRLCENARQTGNWKPVIGHLDRVVSGFLAQQGGFVPVTSLELRNAVLNIWRTMGPGPIPLIDPYSNMPISWTDWAVNAMWNYTTEQSYHRDNTMSDNATIA